jgi:hypothetical protein
VEVKDTYVADTSRYSGPLREAAKEADKFGDRNDKAALAARRMGLAAKEAADKAARAMSQAGEAAEKLAMGEIKADEAAQAEAKALREMERAAIKAAEAEHAVARAADEAAKQERQAARDAELAGAAQRLASLKASGAVREHNSLLADLRKRFPEIEHDASGAFKAMTASSNKFGQALGEAGSSLEELSGVGRAVPGLIIAGLQLLPFAATAAGDGMSLALGGALAAIGLKAQASNADVKKAFSDMRTHVVAETQKISTPFHDTLLHIASDAQHAFDSLEPSLGAAFSRIAPALTRFSGQFSASLSKLDPLIRSTGRAFDNVLASLGGAMPSIMNNFATGLKAITDAAAANPGALTDLVKGVSLFARGLGDTIGLLIRYEHQLNSIFMGINAFALGPLGLAADGIRRLTGTANANTHALQIGSGEFQTFGEQAATGAVKLSALDKDMQTLASTTADATSKANALSDAFARLLNPAEAVFGDTAKLKDSIKAMAKALEESHGRLNDNSVAARAAKQAFTGVIDNAKTLASDMLNSGKSIDQVRTALQPTIAQMYKFAGSNKQARALVDDFVHSLNGMPAQKKISLNLDAQNFFSALHQAQGLKIDPKTGYLRGNNSDYLNKWLRANGLRIDTKTGYLRGNNADYYNKWLRANGLRISTKTGRITGNTDAFWAAVHSIPSTVGYRKIGVYYVPLNSANEPGHTRGATGGLYKAGHFADGGEVSGLVMGPGTGTSDSIPAPWLSNGEFVTREKVTSAHLAALENLNQGMSWMRAGLLAGERYARGGQVDGYAKGGKRSSIGKLEQRQAARLASAAATRARALSRPEELAALAAQHALAAMRSSALGGIVGGTNTSARGTIVQHTTRIEVNVQGSVTTSRDLAQELAGVIMTYRIPVSLPSGR